MGFQWALPQTMPDLPPHCERAGEEVMDAQKLAEQAGIVDADFADHDNDRSRARRYASVKLAAAVGRAM